MKPTIQQPKVFISYAWGSQEYQDRVIALSRDLIGDGIDVLLDKWSLKEGHDTYAYMEQSVNNIDVTNVLILLDPVYAQKANSRSGGVGTETQIISPEIYNNVTQEKFLPVVMERDENGNIPKPSYLRGLLHFDLSKPEQYDEEYRRLVLRLYGVDVIPKPTLGKMPRWVTEEAALPSAARVAINSLKKNTNAAERRTDFIVYLGTLKENIRDFTSDADSYLAIYNEMKSYRDEFLHFLKSSSVISDANILIGDFLQDLYDALYESSQIAHRDAKQVLLHELFVYTIACYFKNKNYGGLEYILNRTYFGKNFRSDLPVTGLRIFYHYSETMDRAKNKEDNQNYYSGTAQHWMDNIATEICNKREFAFADVLIFNYVVYGKNSNNGDRWFPLCYVYDGEYDTLFQKTASTLISREIAERWMKIFGYSSLEEFKQKIVKVNELIQNQVRVRCGYNAAFTEAQLLGDFIKPDDLGKLH